MKNTKGKRKEESFKEFREFLAEKCGTLEDYKNGRYDRKIFNWFNPNPKR